jgi:hypothetical protein
VADEFISFDKVLRELQMQEEELKRLVSEGEIRAFRDQDKMKFKKEDVERFRKVHTSSKDETMGAAEVPEELVFDEDDANQDVGMATASAQGTGRVMASSSTAGPASHRRCCRGLTRWATTGDHPVHRTGTSIRVGTSHCRVRRATQGAPRVGCASPSVSRFARAGYGWLRKPTSAWHRRWW